MYFTPQNIKLQPGEAFIVLSENAVLKPTDLIRNRSDSSCCVGDGQDYNWQTVETRLPYWAGKTLNDLKNFGKRIPMNFEVIRIIEIKDK